MCIYYLLNLIKCISVLLCVKWLKYKVDVIFLYYVNICRYIIVFLFLYVYFIIYKIVVISYVLLIFIVKFV